MTADDRLTFTVPQVARLLGIGRGLAYELVRQGKLPALRFGRRLLIPRVALMRLLAGELPIPSGHPAGPAAQGPELGRVG